MSDKYAIFLDFDGTIGYDNTDVRIHPDNIETIKEARRQGHKVYICTGRASGFIPDFITEQVEHDGIIAAMGAEVYIDNKTVMQKFIPCNEVYAIVDFCFNNGFKFRLEGLDNVYANYKNRLYDFVQIESADEYKKNNYPITSILIGGGYPDESIMQKLEEKYELARHDRCFEFSAKGCSKDNAIDLVLEYTNHPLSKTMAIGDSSNDIGMLKHVAVGIAMGNSYDVVKKEISLTTDTCENAGVAKAIKKHILDNE